MKEQIRLITMREPARRHRCELCNDVFECHLCTITHDHRFHSGLRLCQIEDSTTPVLVCEDCAVSDNCRWVESGLARSSHKLTVPYYDYLTGKTVMAPNRRLTEMSNAFIGKKRRQRRVAAWETTVAKKP